MKANTVQTAWRIYRVTVLQLCDKIWHFWSPILSALRAFTCVWWHWAKLLPRMRKEEEVWRVSPARWQRLFKWRFTALQNGRVSQAIINRLSPVVPTVQNSQIEHMATIKTGQTMQQFHWERFPNYPGTGRISTRLNKLWDQTMTRSVYRPTSPSLSCPDYSKSLDKDCR